jgi:hypothetical protein
MLTRLASRVVAAVAVSGLALTVGATPAFADTSQGTAQALALSLLGGSLLNTGTQSASNGGTPPATVSSSNPSLSLLGTQTTITAGVLAQTAIANPDGTSASCAGLVGNGAAIQIGTNGNCAVTGGGAGGVTINLPGALVLTATAILEECQATSSGTAVAEAQLVDAHITLLGQPVVSLPLNPAAGQTISAGVLSLNLNSQTTPTAGEITGRAFELNVLNVIDLQIGNVSCGPDVATVPTSAFPLKSLPIVGGMVLVLAAIGVPWYRRQRRNLA